MKMRYRRKRQALLSRYSRVRATPAWSYAGFHSLATFGESVEAISRVFRPLAAELHKASAEFADVVWGMK